MNGLEQKRPALADRIVVAANVGLARARAKRKAMSIVIPAVEGEGILGEGGSRC